MRKKVEFEPVLHSGKVVYSQGPKVKQKGNYTRFIYPDGNIVADGSTKPSFEKLQTIRLGRKP